MRVGWTYEGQLRELDGGEHAEECRVWPVAPCKGDSSLFQVAILPLTDVEALLAAFEALPMNALQPGYADRVAAWWRNYAIPAKALLAAPAAGNGATK